MEKNILGRTGLELSVVGLGALPLQRVDEETAYEIIKAAYEVGINFIDTARGYTISEELIGRALDKLGRDKFILATKSMKRDLEGLKLEVERSFKNLRTDYIDLFQFHNVSKMEELEEIISGGGLAYIKELRDQGRIGHIGITAHNADTLEAAILTDEFSSVQFPYNPAENQGERAFEMARERNIGTIVMKPLAGGAIGNGVLSLRYILENPNITTVIPGMDSVDQVLKNAQVGIDRRPLSQEESKILREEVESLGNEFCRRCGYCEPCTVGIKIFSQFLCEGYYSRYNLKDWALDRYANMEKNAGDCIACGICETRCPYKLPIVDMLKDVHKILGR